MAYILDDGESLTISDKPMRLVNGLCEVQGGSFHCELTDEALRILTGCASIAFGVCIPIHATIGDDGKMRATIGDTIDIGPMARRTVGEQDSVKPAVRINLGPVWPPVGGPK